MRKVLSTVLIVVMPAAMLPVGAAAETRVRRQQQPPGVAGSHEGGGTVQGTAVDPQRQPLAGHTAQLRNVQSGAIVRSGTTDGAGQFAFPKLAAGTYVVEIVTPAGDIIGTSDRIVVGDDQVAAIVVTASAAGAMAAAGGAGFGIFGLGTAASVAIIGGVAVGITAGVVAAKDPASPSK